MTTPGWYHATGDPEGTVRYWTGTTWQGEPMAHGATNDVIYYAAAAETEIDLGDIATRTTLASTSPETSYKVSPFSVTSSSVNVKPRKRLPETLKNLTVLVGVFKALPLLQIAFGLLQFLGDRALYIAPFRRYRPPGFALTASSAAVVTVFALMVVAGTMLIVAQVRAAIKDQAGSLFSVAVLMLLIDIVFLLQALGDVRNWTRPGRAALILGVLVLQAVVAAWAGQQSSKS